MMGPSKPPASRLRMMTLPTRWGRLLAPITATECGRNMRCRWPVLMRLPRDAVPRPAAGHKRPATTRPGRVRTSEYCVRFTPGGCIMAIVYRKADKGTTSEVAVRPAEVSDLPTIVALDAEETGLAKPGYWKD